MSELVYTCRICKKPLGSFNALDSALMKHFNMPKDGGAHAECLAPGAILESEHKTSQKASPSLTKEEYKKLTKL